MQLVTLDLETFYDREYSLSKITTEEYVRSHLFETIGIAIKIEDEETVWYPQPEVEQALAAINWSECAVLAQNTMFDGAILRWKYGINPAAWLDTMGMSRALFPHEKSHSLKSQAERAGVGVKGNEVVNALGKRYKDFDVESLARYASYCINDVELTHRLFKRYIGLGFPRIELRLIDLTLRMFIDPVLELDRELLKEHLQDVLAKKEALLSKLSLDDKARLMSNPQLADMLREHGIDPPMKISPLTGKETYAFAKTDEAFKDLLEHEDLEVQAIVAARLGVKSTLEETRTQRFIDMSYRGPFPVPLKYYGARSSRWSGLDSVNLQNLPSRTADAGKLKKAIKAPPGYIVIDSDSSQIEARTLAWLAGQDDLVAAFERKEDVYKIMASHIYGVAPDQITKEQRFIGKTTVLGCGYGVGHAKMKLFLKTGAGVEVSEAEAKRIVDTYRKTYYRIPELWKSSDTALAMLAAGMPYVVDTRGIVRVEPGKGLTIPNSLYIRYPELRQMEQGKWVYNFRGGWVDIYGGKCLGADTEVLTERGWLPIVAVTTEDRVWDGIEWVNHSGLLYQGEKVTIILDGVHITPDHKVLTSKGWVDASSCQGLHRSDFWMPDGHKICGGEAELFYVGVPMHLRQQSSSLANRHSQIRKTRREFFLWLCLRHKGKNSWAFKTPSVLGMALNEGSLQTTIPPSLEKLWGSWGKSMSSLGELFRSVLGGYGAYLCTGSNFGSYRQQRGLHSGELSLGYIYGPSTKQKEQIATNRHIKNTQNDWVIDVNNSVSMAPRPVYDLSNAGPRKRFMVRGDAGPFLVHNCTENFTQAIARCVIAEQMLRIAKRYKVVLTVHDAVACIAPEDEREEAMKYVEECMWWRPSWASGLPLACEAGWGASYGDC